MSAGCYDSRGQVRQEQTRMRDQSKSMGQWCKDGKGVGWYISDSS